MQTEVPALPCTQAWQGGYALLILLIIALLLTVLLSSPGGAVLTAATLQAWLVVWMILSAA